MGWRAWVLCVVGMFLTLTIGMEVRAKQPVFVSWLIADDPGDQTILDYWNRYDAGQLGPNEMVDLGTMLFYRGYPKDAVRLFKAALDQDKDLAEAWFRIGLVEHQQGDLRRARVAYKKSLKRFKGNGWCQFYFGLLEEQEGHSKAAMRHYEKAFRYAPVLADPDINPEMASSDLSLGAWLKTARKDAFRRDLPMPFLDPAGVKRTMKEFTVPEPGLQPVATEPETGQEKARTEDVKSKPTTETKSDHEDKAPKRIKVRQSSTSATKREAAPKPESNTSGGGTPSKSPSPRPTPAPDHFEDTPYGLPGMRSVSGDAYPGF